MADNYLENKFEEYQARKNGKGKPHVVVKHEIVEVEKTETLNLNQKLNIVVVGGSGDFGRSIVTYFSEYGHRVALLNDDAVLGRMTASKTNSVFIDCKPESYSDLREKLSKVYDLWGNIDVVINIVENFEGEVKGVITDGSVKKSMLPIDISLRCISDIMAEKESALPLSIINIGWIYDEKMKGSEPFSSSVAVSLAQSSFMYKDLRYQKITVNSIFVQGDKMLHVEDAVAARKRVECDTKKLISILVNPENKFIQGETFSL